MTVRIHADASRTPNDALSPLRRVAVRALCAFDLVRAETHTPSVRYRTRAM